MIFPSVHTDRNAHVLVRISKDQHLSHLFHLKSQLFIFLNSVPQSLSQTVCMYSWKSLVKTVKQKRYIFRTLLSSSPLNRPINHLLTGLSSNCIFSVTPITQNLGLANSMCLTECTKKTIYYCFLFFFNQSLLYFLNFIFIFIAFLLAYF